MTIAQLIAHLGLTREQWVAAFDRYPWMNLPVHGSPYDLSSVYNLMDVLEITDILSGVGRLPLTVWN